VRNQPLFQLGLDFFGLTPNNASEFRLNLFKEIHEISFHGQGGYEWETVYNMPVWLRRFTYNSMFEFYTKKSEAANGTSDIKSKTIMDPSGKVNKENYKKINYK
jgi:hypothetical protein